MLPTTLLTTLFLLPFIFARPLPTPARASAADELTYLFGLDPSQRHGAPSELGRLGSYQTTPESFLPPPFSKHSCKACTAELPPHEYERMSLNYAPVSPIAVAVVNAVERNILKPDGEQGLRKGELLGEKEVEGEELVFKED